jgi:hypothetical protein
MIDQILKWGTELIEFGYHYPDVASVIGGSLSGYAVGVLVECYFVPVTLPHRSQQAVSMLATLVSGTLLSATIWAHTTPLDLRLAISFCAATLGCFFYPAIARVVTRYFPAVGSVWAKRDDDPPAQATKP